MNNLENTMTETETHEVRPINGKKPKPVSKAVVAQVEKLTATAQMKADQTVAQASAPAPAEAPEQIGLAFAAAPTPAPAPAPTPPAPVPAPAPKAQKAEPPPIAEVDKDLVEILTWKRPFESKAETEFMSWLHKMLATLGCTFRIAARGNVVATVTRPNGTISSVLFSCHTDTVHNNAVPPRQKIVYDEAFGEIFLDKDDPDAGSCLGADDGAGVWLMLQMIKRKVPGTYVFHRGEERGGVGSNALLAAEKTWLEKFDLAVAFDRPDSFEVITHQGGQRCASDKFGEALAKALNAHPGMEYEISARGVFTDTKVYRGVIAECVNLGVGYMNQHGKSETLNYVHLLALTDAACTLNWEALPVDRDPKAVETHSYAPPGGWRSSYGSYTDHKPYAGHLTLEEWEKEYGQGSTAGFGGKPKGKSKADAKKPAGLPTPAKAIEPTLNPEDEFRDVTVDSLMNWFEMDAEEAAKAVILLAAETAALRAANSLLKGAL